MTCLQFDILQVELLCNDSVLDPNSDLRTVSFIRWINRDLLPFSIQDFLIFLMQVKHFIWKSGSDLVLHYRPLQ